MMIKIERADGEIEIFETQIYRISKTKDFHPIICKVSVYENGIKISSRKRPFSFLYKTITFKTKKIQDKLKELTNIENESSEGIVNESEN